MPGSRRTERAVAGARYHGEKFVRTGLMASCLPEYLLRISNLDVLYRSSRANFYPPDPDPIFVEPIPQQEVDDLLQLYRAIPDQLFQGVRIFLNPDLSIPNDGTRLTPTRLAGGVRADGDVIIDDMLLDVKTSAAKMTPKLPLREFSQLMGYFALTSLAGGHRIRRLGVYYARHAYLLEFAVPRVLPNLGGRPAFLEWFRKHLKVDRRVVPGRQLPTRRRR